MSKLLDSTRLQHLHYAAERISRRFLNLLADEDLQDVALRQFMVMGEAAARVSPATKQLYPQIDWRRITGLRNFIAHEYFRVDYTLVWDTIVSILPPLLLELPIVLQEVLGNEQHQAGSSV